MIRNNISFIIMLALPSLALASGGADHDPHAIPVKAITYQAINFFMMVGLLAYLTREKLKTHFAAKKETFTETVRKVERARAEAEKKNFELKTRLNTLEGTAQEAIERASREASELGEKILAEAESMARNVREEASRVALNESMRALQKLREEMVDRAINESRKKMEVGIKAQDQERLQKEFVEKIQVVR